MVDSDIYRCRFDAVASLRFIVRLIRAICGARHLEQRLTAVTETQAIRICIYVERQELVAIKARLADRPYKLPLKRTTCYVSRKEGRARFRWRFLLDLSTSSFEGCREVSYDTVLGRSSRVTSECWSSDCLWNESDSVRIVGKADFCLRLLMIVYG